MRFDPYEVYRHEADQVERMYDEGFISKEKYEKYMKNLENSLESDLREEFEDEKD